MSINDDILYKIDSEIGKDKEVIKLKREIERLNKILNIIEKRLIIEERIALDISTSKVLKLILYELKELRSCK